MPGLGKSGMVRTSALSGSQSVVQGVINYQAPSIRNGPRPSASLSARSCTMTASTRPPPRPLGEGEGEIGERVGVAGRQHFHMAVFGVAHPAIQPERSGLAMDEPAKSDALHAPFDEVV